MNWQRLLPGAIIGCIMLLGTGAIFFLQQRVAHCNVVPLLADELLPNADLALLGGASDLPQGWQAGAPSVKLGTFALDGDNRSIHLMGIASYVETPAIAVQSGQPYCFVGYAITDSDKQSDTRVRVAFRWFDDQEQMLSEETTDWQPVVLWQAENPPENWSRIKATFAAPTGATHLRVRVFPASDDRVYLDVMHVQKTTRSTQYTTRNTQPVTNNPTWPEGKRAALSFSFDWETAMAGLVHSRSVGDPYVDNDPVQRGLRMREGVTTTLEIFRPYGIRATYYAAGYTFLMSNTTKTKFMSNPTYDWATTANRWTSDVWKTTPWFAPDPYGTVQSDPAWYFGDLVSILQREEHDIQSHTFSHFYGGFVQTQDWHDDMQTWNSVASQRTVSPARSLAFPWSSSGGMSYANWDVLEHAGITSITRLSDQSQYNLFPLNERGLIASPHCRPLPGHERILACPDISLTPNSVDQVIEQIDYVRQVGGMIDVWSHTEEVITEKQRTAWQRVVAYVASQPDLWVAPLREIADWQQSHMADGLAPAQVNNLPRH